MHEFIASYNDVYDNAEGDYNQVVSPTDIHVNPLFARPGFRPGWHYIVGSYDSATEVFSIYVDGRPRATAHHPGFGAIAVNDDYVYLGVHVETHGLRGRLDEVAVWDRALGAAEVGRLWSEGEGLSVGGELAEGLMAYWPMEDRWVDSRGEYNGSDEYSTASFTDQAKLGERAAQFSDSTFGIFPETLTPSAAITVAAWVYQDQQSLAMGGREVEQSIFSKGAQGHNDHIWMYFRGDSFYFELGNGEVREQVAAPAVDGHDLDLHLRSERGRWDGSGWVNDAVSSPCIDGGDPEVSYADEPRPNGGRVNIGAYGGTAEASR